MTGIKWVLTVTTFLVFGSVASANANPFCPKPDTDYMQGRGTKIMGDWLPWPFGSECVTPWRKLEGSWIRPQDDEVGKVIFDLTLIFDGMHFLTVKRYDKHGMMLDEGVAEVLLNDKIVSVKMNTIDPTKGGYTLFIRHYPEKGTCEEGNLATVITIRRDPKRCEDDVNFILIKAPKGKS